MNIGFENFQIPSFFFKEQPSKRKFRNKFVNLFYLGPKMSKLIFAKEKLFLEGFLIFFSFKKKIKEDITPGAGSNIFLTAFVLLF